MKRRAGIRRIDARNWLAWPALLVALAFAFQPSPAVACPFCRSAPTISGRLTNEDIPLAVVAELLPSTGDERLRTYRIVKVLKSDQGSIGGDQRFKARLVEGATPGQRFFTTAALVGEPPIPYWDSPQREPVTDAGLDYLESLAGAPPQGRARLKFFLPYLNDPDDFIAEDVYAEIAAASFDDIKSLNDAWPREKLLAWVADDGVPYLRRRQFLVLLGVCGKQEDAAELEILIAKDPGGTGSVLDAAVASYLTLHGEEGLALINDILRDPSTPYAKGMEVAKALRFHGDDETLIDKRKLVPSLRLMLDRPAWADQIMPDLARWDDWSVMDRLVAMFKSADEQDEISRLALRVAVAQYLMACPLPEAELHLTELKAIDARAIDQAERFLILPGGGARRSESTDDEEAIEDDSTYEAAPEDEDLNTGANGAPLPTAESEPLIAEPPLAQPPDAGQPTTNPASSEPPPNSIMPAVDPADEDAAPPPVAAPTAAGEYPLWPAASVAIALALLVGLNAAILLAFRPQS